jgi:hypothetical protein
MATYITVDYSESQLLEQNRRQVDANRLNALEAKERQQLTNRIIETRQGQERIPRGRLRRGRREQLAAVRVQAFNLVVVELEWVDNNVNTNQSYDLNVVANNNSVGWLYSSLYENNNGSIWNQVFWPGDLINVGNTYYEYAIIDLTRTPTSDPDYPGTSFDLDIYIYTWPLSILTAPKLTIYPSLARSSNGYAFTPGDGYLYGESFDDITQDLPRLIGLGSRSKRSIVFPVEELNTNPTLFGKKVATLKIPKMQLINP